MNDELSGQLTIWSIPAYARSALWLEAEGEAVPTAGEYGLFTLPRPAAALTLRWAGERGPALARLPWRVDTLEWDGSVRAGGYVEAIHVTEIPRVSYPVTVIYLGGQPLRHDVHGYPTSAQRERSTYQPPDFYTALAAEVGKSVTTWLVPDESPLAAIAQEALMHNLRLHFFGRLADEASAWGQTFALPILLQAVTLFGT